MTGGVAQSQIRQNMIQRKLMMDRINELSDELQILSCERMQQEILRDSAKQETNSLREEYAKISTQIEIGKEVINKNNTTISIAHDAINSMSKEISSIKREQSEKQEEINELQKELDEFEELCCREGMKLEKIKDESTCLQAELEDDRLEYKHLLRAIDTANDELEAIEEEMVDRQLAMDEQEKKLDDKKQNLDKYKDRLNLYANRLNTQLAANGVALHIEPI